MKIIYSGWLATRIGLPYEEMEIESPLSVFALMDILVERGSTYSAIFKNKDIINASMQGRVIDKTSLLSDDISVTFFAPMAGG